MGRSVVAARIDADVQEGAGSARCSCKDGNLDFINDAYVEVGFASLSRPLGRISKLRSVAARSSVVIVCTTGLIRAAASYPHVTADYANQTMPCGLRYLDCNHQQTPERRGEVMKDRETWSERRNVDRCIRGALRQ
jgi:hypothetical protein